MWPDVGIKVAQFTKKLTYKLPKPLLILKVIF